MGEKRKTMKAVAIQSVKRTTINYSEFGDGMSL